MAFLLIGLLHVSTLSANHFANRVYPFLSADGNSSSTLILIRIAPTPHTNPYTHNTEAPNPHPVTLFQIYGMRTLTASRRNRSDLLRQVMSQLRFSTGAPNTCSHTLTDTHSHFTTGIHECERHAHAHTSTFEALTRGHIQTQHRFRLHTPLTNPNPKTHTLKQPLLISRSLSHAHTHPTPPHTHTHPWAHTQVPGCCEG